MNEQREGEPRCFQLPKPRALGEGETVGQPSFDYQGASEYSKMPVSTLTGSRTARREGERLEFGREKSGREGGIGIGVVEIITRGSLMEK